MTTTEDLAAAAPEGIEADIAKLRAIAAETEWNPGIQIKFFVPQLVRILDEVTSLRAMHLKSREGLPSLHDKDVGVRITEIKREIKTPPDDGPISGISIVERALAICGCKGKYDCDCVSVMNQARRELWTEHNQRTRTQTVTEN